MKEKIILAPNANSTELIRTLAKFGSDAFLMRIFNTNEFAKDALMRSGVYINEKYITNIEQAYIIDSFIKESAYFKTSSLEDSINVANSLNDLRMLIVDDEENTLSTILKDQGEFIDKNNALVEIYNKYISYLRSKKLYDAISLIRIAIKQVKAYEADFIALDEYPLSPLEEELIKVVSKGNYKKISILDLLNTTKKPDIQIDKYTRAYGKINEIEDVISYIYKNNISLDKCCIVITNNSYLQEISDLCSNYNINVTYATGLPITSSNPFKIIDLIEAWNKEGKNGIDSFRNLVTNSAFNFDKLFANLGNEDIDFIIKTIGSLRLSFDSKENETKFNDYKPILLADDKNKKHLEILTFIKDELSKGLLHLLNEYTIIRNEFDALALNTITQAIEQYDAYFADQRYGELFDNLRKKNIDKEISKEGYLHVTGLNNAISCVRENMFIVGMSSSNFPGSPKENYLLLDSDLEMFSKDAKTSIRKINDKKENLTKLLTICKSLNVNVRMSYSSFIIADLKEDNPSSYMFDLYAEQYNDNDYKHFINHLTPIVAYFNHGINNYEEIGKAFCENENIVVTNKTVELSSITKTKTFTPTQIEQFFTCPKRFYLKYIVGIEEPEENDPYDVMDASATGTMYHKLMENKKDNRSLSKTDFIIAAENLFDEYIKTRPAIHEDAKEIVKEEFLDLCDKGYDLDPNNEVLFAEGWIEAEIEGIKVGGFPDRIEKDKEGKQLIADFKTKRRIEHDSEDPITCLQVILYAYIANNNIAKEGIKYNVEKCSYRYPRFGQSIDINYDSGTETFLKQKMSELKQAIDNNDFILGGKDENSECCKYCKLSRLCKRDEQKQEEE